MTVPSPLLSFWRVSWRQRSLVYKWFICNVVVIAVVTCILLAVNIAVGAANLKVVLQSGGQNVSGIRFLGHVYNINVDARQVSISWAIFGCGDFLLNGTAGTPYGNLDCGLLGRVIDVYVDNLEQPAGTYDPGYLPHTTLNGVRLPAQWAENVETTHLLSIDGTSIVAGYSQGDQQAAFPFDRYDLQTTFIAKDHETNETLPILSLTAVDSTQNFNSLLLDDSESTSFDVNGTATTGRTTHSKFERTKLTKAFVMIIFLVNWMLTAVVLYITTRAGVGAEVSESIMLLPVSVILTIPSLRALWVGAPAFGLILDSAGLFPQMIVVSVCSIFLVVYVGRQTDSTKRLAEVEKISNQRMDYSTDRKEVLPGPELGVSDPRRRPEVLM